MRVLEACLASASYVTQKQFWCYKDHMYTAHNLYKYLKVAAQWDTAFNKLLPTVWIRPVTCLHHKLQDAWMPSWCTRISINTWQRVEGQVGMWTLTLMSFLRFSEAAGLMAPSSLEQAWTRSSTVFETSWVVPGLKPTKDNISRDNVESPCKN